jgi:hypothetical protein
MTVRSALMIALLLAGTLAAAAGEPEMTVPVNVQLALFANVLKLDRNFDFSQGATIAIVFQQDYRASVLARDDVIAVVQHLKLSIRCVVVEVGTQELLRQAITDVSADAVYVTPLRAVDVAEIARIARSRDLRTFTGVPSYVDTGLAVGIALRNKRPVILINLTAARAEGSDFSSQLLSLARIVGPL